jgi:hypothetical protein
MAAAVNSKVSRRSRRSNALYEDGTMGGSGAAGGSARETRMPACAHTIPSTSASSIVHAHDVGMVELRECARLRDQALVCAIVLLPWVQDLERDLAVELGIIGRIDHAHAAVAGLAEQNVATELRGRGATEQRFLRPRTRALHVEAIDARMGSAQLIRWFTGLLGNTIRHRCSPE